ncbi:MAG TPA: type 4a pilus biogenesis protein PilO [Frankiaceae bacterium]|jgi:Tfp pilus assembly protein PilO|nr:type 4a pilus biogenesis protein PilO [Frankiaceae bacterium]
MTKLRQLWLLTALASVAILAGGYFLLVSPKAGKAASLRDEAETQQQANTRLRAQIAQLNRQKKDLPRQQAELQKFAAKIPNNPALPALIRSLSDAADNAGANLYSMSPSTPTLVAATVPTTAGATTGAKTAAAPATPALLPIAQIPIALNVVGSYSEVSQFLSEIEGLPRAFLVTSIALTQGDESPSAEKVEKIGSSKIYDDLVTLKVTGQLYMTTKAAPVAPVTAKPAATTAAK